MTMNDDSLTDARIVPVDDIIATLEAARIAISRISALPRRADDDDSYRRGLHTGVLLAEASGANLSLASLIHAIRQAHG